MVIVIYFFTSLNFNFFLSYMVCTIEINFRIMWSTREIYYNILRKFHLLSFKAVHPRRTYRLKRSVQSCLGRFRSRRLCGNPSGRWWLSLISPHFPWPSLSSSLLYLPLIDLLSSSSPIAPSMLLAPNATLTTAGLAPLSPVKQVRLTSFIFIQKERNFFRLFFYSLTLPQFHLCRFSRHGRLPSASPPSSSRPLRSRSSFQQAITPAESA